jgi:hypothetical protein
MTLDNIQSNLIEIVNSGDPVFAEFARNINSIVEQAKTGQMTNEEVAEIMADAQSQLAIMEDMNDLAFKQKLNVVITGLITIARAV